MTARPPDRAIGLWRGVWPPSLIVLGGVALWMTWPAPPRPNPDAPPPRALRVRHVPAGTALVRLHWAPDLFGRPSRVGFGGVRADAPDEGLAPMPSPSPLLFAVTSPPCRLAVMSGPDTSEEFLYRPRIPAPDPGLSVPPPTGAPMWRWIPEGLPPGAVWPSGGWTNPPPLPEAVAGAATAAPWELRVQAVFEGDARPTAVFVEAGSGDPARDLAVVRWLEQTTASETGMVCRCRLWIGVTPGPARERTGETGDGR